MYDNLATRRLFLQRGMALLAVAPTVPAFLNHTAMAMTDPLDSKRTQQASGKDGKILVVVQLSGGNDGLNTVIPYADDGYHRARPVIGHDAKTVLQVNDYIGLHPNLAPLKKLYDDGRMSIIQGVGYPNPNRSHFRSMDIWQSAEPANEVATTGWLGRYFDNACPGCDPHVGVSMGETLPLAMRGDRVMPLSFERPESYRYNGHDRPNYEKLNSSPDLGPASKIGEFKMLQPTNPKKIEVAPASQLEFLTRTAMDAQVSSDEVLRLSKGHQPAASYPTGGFGDGLRTIAAMIGGGMPTRVYYVSLTGFDTHAQERARHDTLMTQLAQGISAFMSDLAVQGNDDRVMMMTFSEFGRRVQQNASGGTDHGAAAPMFVFGKSIKKNIVGDHPSLTNLDQGDLKYTTDFRSIYASILQDWLETPSKPILGQQFTTVPFFKA